MGGVCALREARGIAFLLTPFSTAGRNRTDGLIWPFGNLRMIMMDGIVKKGSDARAAGGRLSKQAKNAVSGGYGWARGFDGGGYVKATIQTEP